MADNKPIHTIRIGMIQAAIWSNPGEHGPLYNVVITRQFRTAESQWRSSTAFGRNDLLLVAKIADAAHTYICQHQAAARSSQKPPTAEVGGTSNTRSENGKRRSR